MGYEIRGAGWEVNDSGCEMRDAKSQLLVYFVTGYGILVMYWFLVVHL
jgi:hypothetical protein